MNTNDRRTQVNTLWSNVPNSPNMVCDKYGLVAIYKDSFGGYGNYWTFIKSIPPSKRTVANRLAVGGCDFSEDQCAKLVAIAKERSRVVR